MLGREMNSHANRLWRLSKLSIGAWMCMMCCRQSDMTPRETVMTEGMRIEGVTSRGTIAVVAGKGYHRTYIWGDCKGGSIELYPRQSRWYGSFGIYYPGSGITWWLGCGGVTRAVTQEGQQQFGNMEDAIQWLKMDRGMAYVYNNEGLVVGFDLIPARSLVSVEVWQILINGKKPTSLEGADDEKIKQTMTESPEGT